MWQAKQTEGFVELGPDYIRLLRNDDGLNWSSKLVNLEKELWASLESTLSDFFKPKTTVNFILPASSGTTVFDVPVGLSGKQLENNLKLNRKTYFHETDELHLKIRNCRPNPEKKSQELLVSYVKLGGIEKVKKACKDANIKLGKITTAQDSLIGAIRRQYGSFDDVNVCIQIGFYRVHVIAFKGKDIILSRVLLSGSVRELQNQLFTSYSISREDTRLYLNGRHTMPVPEIEETIQESRLNLITHIGFLFAELRTKRLLSQNSKIYLSYSVIDDPRLTTMLGDRFDMNVEVMTGMTSDESGLKYEDYPAAWLVGASDSESINLIPPVKVSVSSIIFNPITSVVIAVLLTSLPFPTIVYNQYKYSKELKELREKNAPVEATINEFKNLSDYKTQLISLADQINSDIESRGISARIVRHLTETLPESTRLEKVSVNHKAGRVEVAGITVDTESALRFLDNVKGCKELTKPEITISDLDGKKIRFSIKALIGSGIGRK